MPPALEHTQKLMAFVLISDALEKEGAGERVKWVDLCSQVGCKKAQIYRMRKNMQLYGTQGESTCALLTARARLSRKLSRDGRHSI